MKVVVDGAALPDAEARALWQRFSDWMEEHRGDLAGFAKAEGFASVHPGVQGGKPVLLASRTAPQRPYAAVRAEEPRGPGGPGGGSRGGTKNAKKEKRGQTPRGGGPGGGSGGSQTRQIEDRNPDRTKANPPPSPGKPGK